MARFVFEGPKARFVRAEEENALLDYARWHWCRMLLYPVYPLILVGVGCWLLLSKGGRAGWLVLGALAVLAGAAFGIWVIWDELSGRLIKRTVTAMRKDRPLTPTEQSLKVPVTLIFEGACCHVTHGGTEIGIWDCGELEYVGESEHIWLLNGKRYGAALPKDCLAEGSAEDFRAWLRARAKRYRTYREPERFRKYLN